MLGGMSADMKTLETKLAGAIRPVFATELVRWIALLGLCAAYLQGSLTKLFDFNSAIGEMNHFGLSPAPLFAVLVIAFELVASAMILTGFWRWLGALGLAGFTVLATFVAQRFWEMPLGQDRMMATNAFFEHLGLTGGFLLVAWVDFKTFTKRLH
jgi:uncharacterized membrane protein YphA (DoxX/SURF4 family)